MRESFLLGVDCGLTLIKACVFTPEGAKISEAREETPLQGALMDASALWDLTARAIRGAAAGMPIAACGLSGHGNGLYALDAGGNAVAALSSMARESSPWVRDFDRFFALTRQSLWAGQPMQLLRMLKNADPPRYKAIRHVLQCKDYIRYRLTGALFGEYSDASAAALLDVSNAYSEELCALCGIPEMARAFAPLADGGQVVGKITREAAKQCGLAEGTPVCAGLFDVNACMLGAGVLDTDRYSITAGTWAVSAIPAARPVISREITQCCNFCDREHFMAIVSAPVSCVNLDWFLRNVWPGASYHEANQIAQGYAPDDLSLLYLPYLYEDMYLPGVKGGFVGLSHRHTRNDMLRAVYEGVMFAHRFQLQRLSRAGCAAKAARLSGGAANGALWCQLFADGLDVSIEIPREKQVGALGAALLAAAGVGFYADVPSAVRQMVGISKVYTPARQGAYDAKYGEFLRQIGR